MKVFVQTWGCQMNVNDSERMLGLLCREGYTPTAGPGDADIVLLNTCHIREKARHKLVSRLGELRPLKAKRPELILAVAGCVAQAESKSLAREVPFVDVFLGPDQVEDLPRLVREIKERDAGAASGPLLRASLDGKRAYAVPVDLGIPPELGIQGGVVSRYVNIVKGCNNFCTFCVVPMTRGREVSRAKDEILDEVLLWQGRGTQEVVLLGQNVNSYGLDLRKEALEPGDAQPFADLLRGVAATGVSRIRFTTSNPHDLTHDLAAVFRDVPAVCDHFHLPVQSGSNRVLEAMNRQVTVEGYLERVRWLKEARPSLVFSTDLIVGFPGETEDDFRGTMELVETMEYGFIYAFKYSPRRGTPAARFRDQVPESVKDRRLQELLALQRQVTLSQHLGLVGTTLEVLVLYANRKQGGPYYGRTSTGRRVKVAADRDCVGELLGVEITGANLTALEGVAPGLAPWTPGRPVGYSVPQTLPLPL